MRYLITAASLLSLAACQRDPSPQEKAAADARDVAAVEAAQKLRPPVVQVVPEPMKPQSRALYKLTQAGCDFRPNQRVSEDPVLIAGEARALLLVRGEPLVLGADSGSADLPFGAHGKYTGRDHSVQLTSGAQSGTEGRWPGSLTIRDRFDRIAYFAAGEFACLGPAEGARAAQASTSARGQASM
jgi:hypothetical protein